MSVVGHIFLKSLIIVENQKSDKHLISCFLSHGLPIQKFS